MDRDIQLATLSATAALGDEKAFRQTLREALEGALSGAEVLELVMQTALFAGVPRALNAFRLFHDVAQNLSTESFKVLLNSCQESFQFRVSAPQKTGEQTFESVYGGKTDKLREALRQWHPVFEEWIISEAYGHIISRPGLSLRDRELCAVSALTVLNVPLQLWGHMKGALANGVSTQKLQEVLGHLNALTDHAAIALAMLSKLEN